MNIIWNTLLLSFIHFCAEDTTSLHFCSIIDLQAFKKWLMLGILLCCWLSSSPTPMPPHTHFTSLCTISKLGNQILNKTNCYHYGFLIVSILHHSKLGFFGIFQRQFMANMKLGSIPMNNYSCVALCYGW